MQSTVLPIETNEEDIAINKKKRRKNKTENKNYVPSHFVVTVPEKSPDSPIDSLR